MESKKTNTNKKGNMSVSEAGRIGGKLGGLTTRNRYGVEFYKMIGSKGGKKVKKLINKAKNPE
ncbi:MAG: Em GEA1 (EM1) [Patescibacteria group bacterium]|jgi:general stress protein YciG